VIFGIGYGFAMGMGVGLGIVGAVKRVDEHSSFL
jgi:hypothetical protein